MMDITHDLFLQGNSMSSKAPTDVFDMVPFSPMTPLIPLPASNGSAPPPPARPTEMSKFFLFFPPPKVAKCWLVRPQDQVV